MSEPDTLFGLAAAPIFIAFVFEEALGFGEMPEFD